MKGLEVWLYTLTYRGLGGWERYVRYLTRYLPKYDVKLIIIDSTYTDCNGNADKNICSLKSLLKAPLEPRSRPMIYLDYIFLSMYSATSRPSINVLHIPSQADAHLVNVIKARKYVLTVHGLSMFISPNFWAKLRYGILARTIRRVGAIITVSNWTKELIVKTLDVPASKVHVIYNCVDRSVFNENTHSYDPKILRSLGMDYPYFIHVSSGSTLKNTYVLLKAAELLDISKKGIILLLVGIRGERARRLWEFAKSRGLARAVRILPSVTNDYILATLYRNALAFILPSFIENCPFTLLEAMSCGCVCIVSNKAALPEIAGDVVLYVDPSKPKQLAELMSEVLRGQHLMLKKAAVSRVLRLFVPEIFCKKHIAVYESLMEF